MRGVGRTRPGKAKERVTEERVNLKAKEEELEEKEHSRVENLVMDEIQENHREDVRKLVEMMQKEQEDQEGPRDRVAPNTGADGSHPGHIRPREERRKERDQRDEMG